MYEHIVVALDGSSAAEQVLPYVQALAKRFGSTITLLRVTEGLEHYLVPGASAPAATSILGAPMSHAAASYVVDGAASQVDAERKEAAEYLDRWVRRLRRAGYRASYAQPGGPVADTILEWVEHHTPDMIAMTTHGRGGLERLIMGSVADEVVRKAPCPVLMVRNAD